MEKVTHSCTACGAERAERAFAGGGFPEEAGFCPRCATAAIGLFGGHFAADSSMFASLLQAAVEDKPGFVAARDEHEAAQAAAEDAGVPPDAAERLRVQAIVEDLALAASHAASLELLRGGEHHNVLLGEKPLDPKFKELRRKAHSNRVQGLELRELQKTAGMACNADVKAMLQGQCAAMRRAWGMRRYACGCWPRRAPGGPRRWRTTCGSRRSGATSTRMTPPRRRRIARRATRS